MSSLNRAREQVSFHPIPAFTYKAGTGTKVGYKALQKSCFSCAIEFEPTSMKKLQYKFFHYFDNFLLILTTKPIQ